jgi:uncharacterized protein (TIGR03905 family)
MNRREEMRYTYNTKTACAKQILFDINNNIVSNIKFIGGCDGNLRAISNILDGWTVEQIEEKCKGNTCWGRPTSCADQLAIAVREALNA